jgi:hypothetical protein
MLPALAVQTPFSSAFLSTERIALPAPRTLNEPTE